MTGRNVAIIGGCQSACRWPDPFGVHQKRAICQIVTGQGRPSSQRMLVAQGHQHVFMPERAGQNDATFVGQPRRQRDIELTPAKGLLARSAGDTSSGIR